MSASNWQTFNVIEVRYGSERGGGEWSQSATYLVMHFVVCRWKLNLLGKDITTAIQLHRFTPIIKAACDKYLVRRVWPIIKPYARNQSAIKSTNGYPCTEFPTLAIDVGPDRRRPGKKRSLNSTGFKENCHSLTIGTCSYPSSSSM